MTATLPDDPYHALGLSKDATAAAIKTAYRKLVLKHHPDKVQDESAKTAAADLFHKIQTAWETIGDEDKRERYDATARLANLRKEAMDRDRATRPEMRRSPSQSYREEPRSYAPRESPRSASYRTEEVRPFDNDYFKEPRRDYDSYERSRQPAPRSRPVRQDSKDAERARRRESTKQSSRATARDRDTKYMQAEVESDSDSDRYRRSPRESSKYHEQIRQPESASTPHYSDRLADARDYMMKQQRRSPIRTSSRDDEFVRGADGRPYVIRRGSGRPKQSSRDDVDPQPRRQMERSSSELEEPRRPPNLASTKSAPYDIRLPYEKTRASSVQHTKAEMAEFLPSPVKRADSMPLQARAKPTRQSTLRQTQTSDDLDRRAPSSRSREYADDNEKPTPDGYILEPRRPSGRTQSPESYSRRRSPPDDAYRSSYKSSRDQPQRRDPSPEPERRRGTERSYSRREPSVEPQYSRPQRAQSPGSYRSSRPQPPPLVTRPSNATYTTYSPVSGGGVEPISSSSTRPKLSRGDSGHKALFGEIRSPSYAGQPPDNARYREIRPEYNVRTARRPSEVRPPPGYARGASFQAQTMSA